MPFSHLPLIQALLNPSADLNDTEIESYFNFACVWAFAGTLEVNARDPFNAWWRKTFSDHSNFPADGSVSL
jgi:dynein heavy chain